MRATTVLAASVVLALVAWVAEEVLSAATVLSIGSKAQQLQPEQPVTC